MTGDARNGAGDGLGLKAILRSGAVALALTLAGGSATAEAAEPASDSGSKPNILFIMGDEQQAVHKMNVRFHTGKAVFQGIK